MTTAEVIWRPEARQDLLDIYVAIALDNSGAAERFYSTMEARAETLMQHPRLGTRRQDIRPAMRMLIEGPYLILYEIHPDTDEEAVDQIDIIRVVDGRRDLTKLF